MLETTNARSARSRARHDGEASGKHPMHTRMVAAATSLLTVATMGITAAAVAPAAYAGQAKDNRTECKTYTTDPAMVTTAYHTSPVLPCTLGGKKVTWSAFAWSRNQYKNVFSKVTASGYVTDDAGKKTEVTIPVEVLPENVYYFIDSGTNGATTDEYTAVKDENAKTLINTDKTDQVSADANTWGYVADDSVKVKGNTKADDKYDTGLYGGEKGITYRLPLKAGSYSINAGVKGWWGNTGTVTLGVYGADGVQLGQNSTATVKANANSDASKLDFTLAADSTVELRVSGSTRISWLTVAKQYSLPKVYLSYGMSYSRTPNDDQADAYWRIVNAVDAAVDRWNTWSNANPDKAAAPHTFTLKYNTGVPTAQTQVTYGWGGNGYSGYGPGRGGTIEFGKGRNFMVEGTAIHEIGHLFGSGYFNYGNYCVGGKWAGPKAIKAVEGFGTGETLKCGGVHMWPYSNNYDTEWKGLSASAYEQQMNRSIEMFSAVSRDVENPAPYFTVRTAANGKQYSAYDQAIRVAGQSNQGNTIKVSLKSGTLPKGITLDPTDRDKNGKENTTDAQMYVHLKGRPLEAGTFTFTLQATNKRTGQDGLDNTATYTITIDPAGADDLVVGTYNATDADDLTKILPTSKTINSNTELDNITWDKTSLDLTGKAWQTVTVTGNGTVTRADTKESFTRPVSATVNVVPAGLTYYIDSGAGKNGTATIDSPTFDQVAATASLKGKLLNTVSDQQSTDAGTWGLVDTDATRRTSDKSTAVRDTGWSAKDGDIAYRLPLKAGKYTITSESARWSGTNRVITPSVSWTDADGKTQTVKATADVLLDNSQRVYGTGTVSFELPSDAVVTYTLARKSGGTPTIDSLYVVRDGDATPTTTPVQAVTVSATGDIDLTAGKTPADSVQLIASVEPVDATDKTVKWSSSDDSVATVDESGLVTVNAKSLDKDTDVMITATSNSDPTVYGTITLTVKAGTQQQPNPPTTTVDKKALQAKVDEVKDYQMSQYTVGSWRGFAIALKNANAVLTDKNATQSDVDNALVNLTNRINRLRLR